MSFFKTIGGFYYDQDGKLNRYKIWWPMRVGLYIDSFFRTLAGRGVIGIPSTQTVVHRSGNTHTPKDQKICLVFIDPDNPGRMIWGSDMTAEGAREIAKGLAYFAEQVDPRTVGQAADGYTDEQLTTVIGLMEKQVDDLKELQKTKYGGKSDENPSSNASPWRNGNDSIPN